MTHLFLSGVLEEAEFYNIASLVRLVKERIRDNENRTSQVPKTQTKTVRAGQRSENRINLCAGLCSSTNISKTAFYLCLCAAH